jgi:hypothetical protein
MAEPASCDSLSQTLRQWTFQTVIDRLRTIRSQRIKMTDTKFEQITLPEEDQQKFLDLLNVKL